MRLTPQRGWRRRASLALVATAATALSIITGSAPAGAAAAPGYDEIVSSPNMKQLANIPPTAPLDGEHSVGTDMAFTGDYLIEGNYLGFRIIDIKHPHKPKIVSQVVCPGAQNDVTVQGNLLFLSVDRRMSDDSCNAVVQPDFSKPYWEGVRIFDISDKKAPKYLKAVATSCGSHTHTLVPGKDGKDVYLYISSYSPSSEPSPNNKCRPPHDSISIVKVPVKTPTDAAVIAEPNLFPDGGWPGNGDPKGINAPGGVPTSGCHDITAYPEKDIAAGACMGDGILLNIADPANPKVINRVSDTTHFAFWHSATFNNDGTKVIFTDELGGGGSATCNEKIGPTFGADGIYDITGAGDARKLEFRNYFKIDRFQTDSENCVAHNGSLIPVKGRDIMVQSWYMGGVQVWDFTDSAHPQKIGYWERGPVKDGDFTGGGTWSSYYYNGIIYSSDIGKGLDVLDLNDPRTNIARGVRFDHLNVQTQHSY